MSRIGWIVAVAVFAVGCEDASDDGVSPRIDLLAPPQAGVGDVVEILGVRFCGPGFIPPPPIDAAPPPPVDGGPVPDAAMPGPPDASPPDAAPPVDGGLPADASPPGAECEGGFVTFGSHAGLTSLDTVRWTDNRITVVVPNVVPGPTGVVVTVEGRQSQVADFTVIE